MTKTTVLFAALLAIVWNSVVAPFILLWCFNTLFPALAIVYTVKVALVLALAAFALTLKITVKT